MRAAASTFSAFVVVFFSFSLSATAYTTTTLTRATVQAIEFRWWKIEPVLMLLLLLLLLITTSKTI